MLFPTNLLTQQAKNENSVTPFQNWIRNRRRPAAIKSAERLVEKMSQGDAAPFTPPTSLTSLISSSMHTATTAPIVVPSHPRTLPPGHVQSQAPGSTQGNTAANISQQGLGLAPSDPKKFCLDQGRLIVALNPILLFTH